MSTPARSLRADAARNRELLLAAAEEEFAERGLDASMADIASRAGVAKGTVFRHFATKEDLVAAIVGDQFAALAVVARELLGAPDAGEALLEFLTVAAAALQRRDLTFLQAFSEGHPMVSDRRDQLHAAVGALVDRAQAAGVLRPDVTGTDVFLLVCAPVHAAGFHPRPESDLWRRYLGVIFDGLRREGATPLPRPAPPWP
ncbi:TetR/AcrR family transcriptional regulator [Pseudonocardia sp. WMMC193]|uniref:TetR/AcrR family transcriptional regulator n=1 Tax=Pseudonocardia sp. WMMC193 TaxID=2911965 RepID=UPI001F161086|nr:TetR/AcrR family transcriptional regulator [Pseudonocardia sp. WMMC193]MCF7549359.1 TetR/AcrR family transcriptional regulator [Pseudonocardia sp. WMMC193]